nr:cytochrome P450 [Trichocoleus sp. FACHB-40]
MMPPSPTTPKILPMLQWLASPMTFMDACAARYGDIFTLPLGAKFSPGVFTSNPQALQEILTDSKHFEAPGETNQLLQPFLGDRSVITVSGTRHQR